MPGDNRALAYVDWFLAQREAEGCKAATVEFYRGRILGFIQDTGLEDITELGPKHAVDWSRILRARGLKSGGINSTQRPVWSWFRWLYDQDVIAVDISRKVKKTRPTDITRRTATPDIKEALLEVVSKHKEMPYRDVAIIELLWGTGIRREELTRLTYQDLDTDAGTLEVLGKGDRRRTVTMEPMARAALMGYINKERFRGPGPLFLSRGKRGGITPSALRLLIVHAAEKAGVTVSAHDFRRAHAANMLAAGVGFDSVMYQMGHTTPAMTIIYGEKGRKARAHAEIKRVTKLG